MSYFKNCIFGVCYQVQERGHLASTCISFFLSVRIWLLTKMAEKVVLLKGKVEGQMGTRGGFVCDSGSRVR